MALLTSPIQDPPRTLLGSLPIFKMLSWLLAMYTPLPIPSPAALPSSPGGEPGRWPLRDSPGRWRSAGAPGSLAAALWIGALERARGSTGGKRAAQPGRGLQSRSPGRPRSRPCDKTRPGPLPRPLSWHGAAPSSRHGSAPSSWQGSRPILCDWAGLARAAGSRAPQTSCCAGAQRGGSLRAAV